MILQKDCSNWDLRTTQQANGGNMTEESKIEIQESNSVRDAIEEVRDFLCGYQLCLEMLNLKRYERKRAQTFSDTCDCSDVLAGNEALWRARMFEIGSLISSMKNGREKVILYCHYIKGDSIEHAADILGVSRRTGYRIHQRGLLMASFLYSRQKKQKK